MEYDKHKYRKCSTCGEILPLNEKYFYKVNRSKKELTYRCKICKFIYDTVWRHKRNLTQEERDKINERLRNWQRNNRNKTRIYDKKYKETHPDETRERQRNDSKKRYYLKKDTDANYIVSKRLRTRVYLLLREHRKSQSTMELLGCTMDFFLNHIKSLWQEGMTWDNYGKNGWVLDHIRPCASFDLSNEKERFECFNYTNIVPMWEKDNLQKGSFYNGKLYRKQQLITNI